jgi:hypothetical protein
MIPGHFAIRQLDDRPLRQHILNDGYDPVSEREGLGVARRCVCAAIAAAHRTSRKHSDPLAVTVSDDLLWRATVQQCRGHGAVAGCGVGVLLVESSAEIGAKKSFG